MASPDVLDVEALLEPVDEASPCGPDLREDYSPTSIYRTLKDARNAARAAERAMLMADADSDVDPPDWSPLLEQAPEVIATQAKDLEVAAWLTEALVRAHGFAGLRDGFRLMHGLVDRYWDDLYPRPDEDGILTRIAPLTGLNGDEGEGTLINPIRNVPLTEDGGDGALACWHYQQACEVAGISDPDRRRQRIAGGAVTLEQFQQAARQTPVEFFRDLIEDLDAAAEAFDQLNAALEERCGKDESGYPLSPPSSRIREALEQCRDCLRGITRDVLIDAADDQAVEAAGGEGIDSGGDGVAAPAARRGGVNVPQGPIQSRAEALDILSRVARFFRETEPHSPLPFALEQVVRWGRMPLPDLLMELIPDESAREAMFRLTGIPEPQQEEQEED